jgi:CubicO group peptidase (beta-lactamase class C family)
MRTALLVAALLLNGCASGPALDVNSGRAAVAQRVVQGFSGVVLVARAGRPALLEAHGGAPNDGFWIASTGKQFVSAAALVLVDQGRLDLDAPLSRFFADVPADKAAITVRQLLTHHSGIGQSYVSEGQTSRASAVAAMFAEPLEGTPGDEFRYSNSNFQLVAAIIEVVSGVSYGQFVQQLLWTPADMSETGFAGDSGAARVAPILGELPPRLRQSYWGEQGVYSTAGDLNRWLRALESGRILREESYTEFYSTPVNLGRDLRGGLGWYETVSQSGARVLFTRGNEDFGANSLIYVYPEADVSIIILTHAGQSPEDLSWSRLVLGDLEAAFGL